MGCNEVPKAGGGTYWDGDKGDKRDFVLGHDPDEVYKFSLLVDIVDRLAKGDDLSPSLSKLSDPHDMCKHLLNDGTEAG